MTTSVSLWRRVFSTPSFRPLTSFTRSFSSASVDEAEVVSTPASSSSSPSSPSPSTVPMLKRLFHPGTLRRQAMAMTRPHYISAKEHQFLRRGAFGESVNTKPTAEFRNHKPEYTIRSLRKEYQDQLSSIPGRHIDDFAAGDKVVVTRYISLDDKVKFERIPGVVICRKHGDRLGATFTVRSHKLGEDFEMIFPLHSPFIARVDVVEKSQRFVRSKMYYIRDLPRLNWEVRIPQGLPKPTSQPEPLLQSEGKTVVLQALPMRKQTVITRLTSAETPQDDKKGGGAKKK